MLQNFGCILSVLFVI